MHRHVPSRALGSYATDDCVLMDTYMTRDPCQNDMFTNSNKAFINFNNFLNKRVYSFAILNCQKARKRLFYYLPLNGGLHEFF